MVLQSVTNGLLYLNASCKFIIDTNFPEVWTKSLVLLLELVLNLGCNWSLLQSLHRICRKGFIQAQYQLQKHRSVACN